MPSKIPLFLALALVPGAVSCRAVREARGPQKPDDEAWMDPQMDHSEMVVKPAAVQKVPTELTTSGVITFSDLHVSHVFSPVSGRIIQLRANLGQTVNAGDTLCYIDSPDLGSAYSDMVKGQADLTAAKADYDREKALLAQGAAAEAQVEQSNDNYEKALAEFERAKRKVETLHADPDAASSASNSVYALRAPIAGQVVARNATLGYEVQGMLSGASVATELYTIGDLHEVWAMLDIYERDLSQIEVGDTVEIYVAAYDQAFPGRIEYISQIVDPQSHTVKVRAVVPNPGDKLKADMFAKAVIDTGTDDVLAVPAEAVVMDSDQPVVFVEKKKADGTLDPDKFVRTPVQIRREGDFAEILGGALKAGDPVVVSGRGAVELLGLL